MSVPKTVAHLREAVRRLLDENSRFMEDSGPEYFAPFLTSQEPEVTVVCCSDSRVHTQAVDSNPDNRLFVVRNIGNQMATSEGSVEYAVHHLRTPILLILGHVRCGAIAAAAGDYSGETPAIRRELETLKVVRGGDWLENVRSNVNDQVEVALRKFEAQVKGRELVVIGSVYDFADDLGHGCGKLVITNINGEFRPLVVKAFLAEHLGEKP